MYLRLFWPCADKNPAWNTVCDPPEKHEKQTASSKLVGRRMSLAIHYTKYSPYHFEVIFYNNCSLKARQVNKRVFADIVAMLAIVMNRTDAWETKTKDPPFTKNLVGSLQTYISTRNCTERKRPVNLWRVGFVLYSACIVESGSIDVTSYVRKSVASNTTNLRNFWWTTVPQFLIFLSFFAVFKWP